MALQGRLPIGSRQRSELLLLLLLLAVNEVFPLFAIVEGQFVTRIDCHDCEKIGSIELHIGILAVVEPAKYASAIDASPLAVVSLDPENVHPVVIGRLAHIDAHMVPDEKRMRCEGSIAMDS